MLECLVFASQSSKIKARQNLSPSEKLPTLEVKGNWETQTQKIAQIRKQLPILVWQSAGICRNEEVMQAAITQINFWREDVRNLEMGKYVLHLPPNQTVNLTSEEGEEQLKLYGETLNLVDVAYLILKSAAFRRESRGGHYRSDYPETLPEWQVHTLVQGEDWKKA